MSNCQSLNKNLENSFHIELMDSLLYFYECKIHVGKSVENTGHIFMYYVPVVNKAMKDQSKWVTVYLLLDRKSVV